MAGCAAGPQVRRGWTGRIFASQAMRQVAAPALVQMHRRTPMPRCASSSLKFCLVAEGAVGVYARLGPTCIWDTAAGQALVVVAGGQVCQMDGAPGTTPR